MIAILHAYSRRNPGDGLLLDLALEHLRGAGVAADDCVVFALDAASFPDLKYVRQIGVARSSFTPKLLPATVKLIAVGATYATGGRMALGEAAKAIQAASGIVGIAGGYLRAGGPVASLGALINHVPQLALAAQSPRPSIYLPQSIGPLEGRIGGLIRRLLEGVDLVCCRDDSSMTEVGSLVNARRFPDLAVMQVAAEVARREHHSSGEANIVIVARDLGNHAGYEESLRDLASRLPGAVWAVQSEGEGRKHDGEFCRRLGFDVAGPLVQVLEDFQPGVVVAVRLHGALQALISGWPAVHLSYQRKGWGAYGDLGLGDYVHPARGFDSGAVAGQVESLRRDASGFWAAIAERTPKIMEASETLTAELRRRLG